VTQRGWKMPSQHWHAGIDPGRLQIRTLLQLHAFVQVGAFVFARED
jgi:hypothetical protein